MYANNEIGTIEPIAECAKACRDHKVPFHTDAVQAIGSVPIDVKAQNVDLLSLSAHKFYGPKGVGALYVRKGVRLDNLIHGGGQERRRRAGTENIPGIVGLGTAIERAEPAGEESRPAAHRPSRPAVSAGSAERIEHVRLNGHPTKRLPGNLNCSFEFIEGESMLLLLDHEGICASSGSACTSGSLDPSHVLLAIGLAARDLARLAPALARRVEHGGGGRLRARDPSTRSWSGSGRCRPCMQNYRRSCNVQ